MVVSPCWFRSVRKGNVLVPVVDGQVEAAVAPIRGAPFGLGELDAFLRRGDEVPPDVTRSVERCTAEDHQPRASLAGRHGDAVAGPKHHHLARFEFLSGDRDRALYDID